MLQPFIKIEPIAFFLTFAVRSLPLNNLRISIRIDDFRVLFTTQSRLYSVYLTVYIFYINETPESKIYRASHK